MYTASPTRYDGCMRYRRCGRSGVMLPEISLGWWHNFGGVDPLERSLQMACRAFDRGVTHFDLANNYGPPYGSAESTLRAVMEKALGTHRDELFISTKAGYDMWPGPYGEWGSRKYLMASIDQSLRRMGLEYVDLFYSHRYDPETPIEETLQTLVDIVRRGKALYIGISRWPLDAAMKAYKYLQERDVPCLIYQGKLNLLDRSPQTDGSIGAAMRNGAGFIGFSPLAQGLLSDRYSDGTPPDSRMAQAHFLKPSDLTPSTRDKVRKLHDIAARRSMTAAQLSLAWVLAQKGVTSVIVGTSSVAQLDENLDTMNHPPLTPEEANEIGMLFAPL